MKQLHHLVYVPLFLGFILITGCSETKAPIAPAGEQSLLKSGDDESEKTKFRFVSVSGNTAGADVLVMAGNGFVSDGHVVAIGSYNHTQGGPPPQPFADLGFGTWEAKRLVSFELIGTYGAFAAGTVVMEVTLMPEGGNEVSAELTMNCSIPPAGLFTNLNEGFYLSTVGGVDFEPVLLPVADGGPPPMIAIGATVFIIGEQRDNDDDDDD